MVLALHAAALYFQSASPHRSGWMQAFRHLGLPGVFLLAVLDSMPIPTLGGPDILDMILAAHHADPWYYYAAATTLGSVIGACVTFRAARHAGSVYLERAFGQRRVAIVLNYFQRWGRAILALSCFFPFPFPTSAFFAAAGVLNYSWRAFVAVVIIARAGRYFILAALSSYYGRRFIHLVRHPAEHTGWLFIIVFVVCILTAGAILIVQKTSRQQSV